MIVDVFTHIWESPQQLGRSVEHVLAGGTGLSEPRGPDDARSSEADGQILATPPQHLAACEHTDRAIVVGFKSHYLDANVPNHYVADYVNQHPEKLIGFAGLDPSNPAEALRDLEEACGELRMQGVAIAPAAQDFHPASSNARRLYEKLSERQLPMVVHQGIYSSAQNKLEYARPVLLDEVAREFPDLKIIIAHMGYPWIDETIVMLGKHAHVYSDVSGLLGQPWRAYNALLSAYQYGVMDKLLFGSGFPFTSAVQCIEALYGINQLCHGTELPTIPRKQLRGIVERPTLEILGIGQSTTTPPISQSRRMVDDEE